MIYFCFSTGLPQTGPAVEVLRIDTKDYLYYMPVRRTIPYTFGAFFITLTNHRWMKLFDESDGYDVVYRWYDYLKEEGNFIHAYVIMPNHVHYIISFAENGQNINTSDGNGKRFMAYEIVERLKAVGKTQLFETLSLAVRANCKLNNQKHSIWEPSFDRKYCYGMEFIM